MIRLLVVDDNEQNRYLLEVLLRGHGHAVTLASNGAEALEAAHNNPPDMIITDILMPVMDGYALCRLWKKDAQLKEIPFVFYTATYTDPQDEQLALSLGAERFILKPQEPQALLDMIEDVIQEHKAGRLTPPIESAIEESAYFHQYNAALIRKLENKLLDIETVKVSLEREIAEHEQTEERLRRLAEVLRAIRNVNHLITHERDRDTLLRQVCATLTEMRGYRFAWIGLLEATHGIHLAAESGVGEAFAAIRAQLERAEWPDCCLAAFKRPESASMRGAEFNCARCFLARTCHDAAVLANRLHYAGRTYGVLVVALPETAADDDEEESLFRELCADIGFALHAIDGEEDRRQAVNALLENVALTETILDNLPVGVAVNQIDPAVAFRYMNDKFPAFYRTTREKLASPDAFWEAVYEDPTFREAMKARVVEDCSSGDSERMVWHDVPIARKGRETTFITARNVPIPDKNLMVSTVWDVTDRKRAEDDALRAGREWQRTFDATNSAVWILDRDQRIVRSNKTSERMFQHSCNELAGKHCWKLIHHTEEPIPECPVVRARKSLRRESHELQIGTGWFEITVDPLLDADGEYEGAVHVVSDITERKQAEHDLLASETRYRGLFESAKDGILILDAGTGRIVDINPFLVDLLGYDAEYFRGKKLWEVDLFRDIAASEAAFVDLQEKGYIRYEDVPLQAKDGRQIDVEFVCNGYLVDSAKVVQCNIRNITERKRVEEALALHDRRVQALLDLQQMSYASEDQVLDYVLDASLRVTQSAYSFVGTMDGAESVMTIHRWSEEVMEKCALPATAFQFEICAAGLWADCVRLRKPVICNDYGAPHLHKKGLPKGHVAIDRFIAVPVLDHDRIVAVAAVANKAREYTEEDAGALLTLINKMWEIMSRQRMEHEREALAEQYRQAQKLEAIGQLAGGVAHDFNNILQAMVGYSGMLLDRLPEQDETHEFAEEIAHSAERAAALTRQLLTFSRRQILDIEDLDLNEVVLGLTKMIRRIIGENIEVTVVEGRALDIVKADRGQLEQVLLNLCINARDAMPDGGALTIGTENVVLDAEYCATHAWASPGRYAMLRVTDTGCGMDAPTQARIFEPFFTTKDMGKGTGLGLATVYGIVRQHQGIIQLYSEVGKGTVFKVYLPSFDQARATAAIKHVERAQGGTETILVAEDDEMLRNLATRILEGAGYTVVTAVDGKDAIEVFEKHGDVIDLALLDVVMPRMGGKAVYEFLREQVPSLRFLFSSGYSTDAIHTGFVLHEGIELIQKPYGPNALLSKVREVLDRADVRPDSESNEGERDNRT